jgi:predicted Zn-dependent protease
VSPVFGRRSGGSFKGRLVIAAIVAIIAIVGYYSNSFLNPVTGRKQHIAMTVDQEIALGLQAAPEMAQQFGGLAPDPGAQALVDSIGHAIATKIETATETYPFDFHVLADNQTVNAFALPGGQIFITEALMNRLETEGQLAGVLGHEIGHVLGRHSAEQLAKAQLTQGLTGAAVIAATDPNNPGSLGTAQIAAVVGQVINTKFSREHELESDRLAVRFIAEAGYDPRAMIRVMQILAEASGGGGPPEFMSTHPDPGNRIAEIERAIKEEFPQGLPDGLKP